MRSPRDPVANGVAEACLRVHATCATTINMIMIGTCRRS
jgi:hypothetical protein